MPIKQKGIPQCSGEVGRTKLLQAAIGIPDDVRSKRILKLTEDERSSIKYHSVTCYANYIKVSKKQKSVASECSNVPSPSSTFGESSRVKRQKKNEQEICVICGSDRVWDNTLKCAERKKLYRLCEEFGAQKLLNAAELKQDSVFTRLAIYYDVAMKALFAADVKYHGNCLRKYIREYDRKIASIINNLDKEDCGKDEAVLQVFKNVLSSCDLENYAYSISFVRDEINKQLSNAEVTNRNVKNLLLQHYD